jgi:hypothetical protein
MSEQNHRSAPSARASTKSLAELATEDKALEAKQDSAVLALMEHRWKAVNEHGYGQREYARAIGRVHSSVGRHVRAWAIWQGGHKLVSTPVDALVAASMGPERLEAAHVVATAHGLTLATVYTKLEHREQARRVHGEIDAGAEIFERAGHEPAEASQLAAEEVRTRVTELRVDPAETRRVRAERERKRRERSALPQVMFALHAAGTTIEESLRTAAGLDLSDEQAAEIRGRLARIAGLIAEHAPAFSPVSDDQLGDLLGGEA